MWGGVVENGLNSIWGAHAGVRILGYDALKSGIFNRGFKPQNMGNKEFGDRFEIVVANPSTLNPPVSSIRRREAPKWEPYESPEAFVTATPPKSNGDWLVWLLPKRPDCLALS